MEVEEDEMEGRGTPVGDKTFENLLEAMSDEESEASGIPTLECFEKGIIIHRSRFYHFFQHYYQFSFLENRDILLFYS